MNKNDTTEERDFMPEDLPELRHKLARLLMVQHQDSRSLRDLKRDMLARGKEISGLSDLIEALED